MQNIGKQKWKSMHRKGKAELIRILWTFFPEHLGECIYNGIFVGSTDSKIPNNKGMRMLLLKHWK